MLNFDDLLRISTAFWCSPFDYRRSFQCRRVHICFLKLSVPRLRKMPVLRCYPGLQWSSLFRSRVRLDTTCFLLSWLSPLFTALFFSHNLCLVGSSCLEGDRKKGSSELDSHSGRNDLAWSADANLRERYQCFLWHHKGLNPWIVHFSELLQHADPLIQDHSCCKHTTTVIAGLTARGRRFAGRKSSGEDRPVLSHCPHAPVCLFLRLWEPLQLASHTHILFASFSTARMSLPLFVIRPPFLILAVWLYNPLLENRRLTNLFGSGLETYFPNIMWWLKLT